MLPSQNVATIFIVPNPIIQCYRQTINLKRIIAGVLTIVLSSILAS
jgi:hypothetical protein